ncbi:MAG: hypothetical protein E7258_05990 [Lachnospiraceae bacterium]|nr:hypothetical protein [Lachnospiraceae bacterium]
MKKNNEQGAIVVEAAMSLPIYIFLIITILSIVNICYIQTKVQIALNTSAKQVSQCLYIYHATNANELLSGEGGTSSAATAKVSNFMNGLMEKLGIENEFLTSFSEALGGTSLAGIVADQLAEGLMEAVTENVLITTEGETADEFYKRMDMINVVYESDISSDGKTLMAGVKYQIEVINLFNNPVTIDMYNVVTTGVWGN